MPSKLKATTPRENYVSLQDVATYLAVDERTIRRWVSDKKVPAKRIGRKYRFKLSEVETALIPAGSLAKAGA